MDMSSLLTGEIWPDLATWIREILIDPFGDGGCPPKPLYKLPGLMCKKMCLALIFQRVFFVIAHFTCACQHAADQMAVAVVGEALARRADDDPHRSRQLLRDL